MVHTNIKMHGMGNFKITAAGC